MGATRLSIIDPDAGAQPVYNETGTVCVVFNGEIYNHRDLREQLQAKGHRFRTRTDTEVIVHLYEEFGDACVQHLHGMFAFAVLDGARVLLARDRLGIKPLYFALDRDARMLLFASEIKAILRHRAFTPRVDLQALADSIVLGFPTQDHTFFDGVRSLRPGHTLVVGWHDGLHVGDATRYFSRAWTRQDDVDFDDAQARLDAALTRAVETHMAADMDVGLTLSGGIDSTLLALLASEHRDRPIFTFSVADHERHPDVEQARRVAQMVGSNHQTVIIGFEDYLAAIPDLIAGEEQPDSLYGIPFYILCRVIGQQVKACLHGEGADELFGGYREYVDRHSRISYIARRLPLLKRLGVSPSPHALETIRRLSVSGTFDDYLDELFDVNMAEALERQHLVPVDKCAMAASVEMRVPYLDDAVVDLVMGLPLRFLVRHDIGVRKYIMRRLALGRFGPGVIDIVLREKLGAPTAGIVLLDEFNRLCEETLPDAYVTHHDFGGCFDSKRELFLFDVFLEVFMKHRGDAAAMGPVVDLLRERGAQAAGRRPSRVAEETAAELCAGTEEAS